MKLDGKRALVTGGTDGIGLEIARALQRRGATILVCGRDPGRIASASAEGFGAFAADLATPSGIDAAVAAAQAEGIDILVNNAGMGTAYEVSKAIDLAAVDRCVALNLTAPIHLISRLLDGLRARPESMIVNVTSGLALAPNQGSPIYCATKAALRSYTMALRAQLADSHVHVLEALPPVVETRMTAENRHKKMPAPECARQIVTAMEAGRAEAMVGMTGVLNIANNFAAPIARRIMLRY